MEQEPNLCKQVTSFTSICPPESGKEPDYFKLLCMLPEESRTRFFLASPIVYPARHWGFEAHFVKAKFNKGVGYYASSKALFHFKDCHFSESLRRQRSPQGQCVSPQHPRDRCLVSNGITQQAGLTSVQFHGKLGS